MQGSIPREAKLTLLTGTSALGSEFTLSKPEQIIGRQPDCDILIAHPTVSGRHARIFFYENDFMIEDLGSTNGTAVNHRAISGPVVLRSGDVVQVGEVHMQFADDVGATMIEPAQQAAFTAQPVDDDLTAVEAEPGAWSAPADFPGEQRVSWAEPPAESADAPAPSLDKPAVPVVEPFQETPSEVAPVADEEYPASPDQHPEPPERYDRAEPVPTSSFTDGESADVGAEARGVLTALATRVDDLQRGIASITEETARLESILAASERDRDDSARRLQRVREGVDQFADEIDSQTSQLGIDAVLSNLEGLNNSPNDLGLLVNVSRDAGRYAALVRLVQDLSARLRSLNG